MSQLIGGHPFAFESPGMSVRISHETIENLHRDCFRVLRWDSDVDSVELFDRQSQRFVPIKGRGGQWHRHSEIEITLVVSGNGIRVIGDESSAISGAASLVMIGRGLPHYWRFNDSSSGICIQFSDVKLLSLLTEHSRVEILDLLEEAAYGVEFGPPVLGRATELLNALITSVRESHVGSFGLLLQLLGLLSSADPTSSQRISTMRFDGSINNDHYLEMQKAIQWIAENYQSEIRLRDVLDLTQMSKASFNRHFVKCTGLSFSHFVNDIRVSNACRLLHVTQESISAIALESGFANLSNFNRIFLRRKGVSPTRYRKNNSAK